MTECLGAVKVLNKSAFEVDEPSAFDTGDFRGLSGELGPQRHEWVDEFSKIFKALTEDGVNAVGHCLEPTVDGDFCAGDETVFIGDQKKGHFCQLVGRAQTLERALRQILSDSMLRQRLGQPNIKQPG